MANDKKFIVKNGLLTPENAVIGSTTDTGEKLQVTGDTVLTQGTQSTATLKVTNSGGHSASTIIAAFEGDSDSLQIRNISAGDYKITNPGIDNSIEFHDDTAGIVINYAGSSKLAFTSTGTDFTGLSTTTIEGNRILTTADEGSGNGLDADTVDGLEASQFLRSDVDDTAAGNIFFSQDIDVTGSAQIDVNLTVDGQAVIKALLDAQANAQVAGSLTVGGDLTVSGNTTYVNTEEILLSDNIITLNANYTGSTPSENAGIEVERGTLVNPKLVWNETGDYWQLEVGGSVLGRIITTADEGANNGFDADTVDGLEGYQFLRSDVDDTAAGNITIQGDLTLGDNVGPAQIFFDGQGVNRTIYHQNGEIGFLNNAANWAMKSDAQGDLEVERDVEAGRDVIASNDVTATQDITATSGNITATAGNISATAGSVSAGTTVNAGTDVIAQNNITATTGDITATAGDVIAGDSITAQNNITATTGNISASAGSVSAATDVIGQRFVDADNNTYVVNPNATSVMKTIQLDDYVQHSGDTNTYIGFPANDQVVIGADGSNRVTVTSSSVTVQPDLYAPRLIDSGNNTYIVDPAGNSVLNTVSIDSTLSHNGDTDTLIRFDTATIDLDTDGVTRLTANNSGVTIEGDLDVNGDITAVNGTFTGDLSASRFIDSDNTNYYADPNSTSVMKTIGLDDYIQHNGDTDTYFGFNANDNYQVYTGGTQRFEVNGTNITGTVDAIFPDVYAGRFYDLNNATYYVDPASNSRVNGIGLVGTIFHDGDTDTYLNFNAANSFEVVTGNTQRLLVNDTYVLAANQMRSPIYYDNDNTAYYGNFAGTSVMNDIGLDDYIAHNGDTNTYFGFDANDSITFFTGGSERLNITDANSTFYQTVVVEGDIQADKFVDRQNTSYYVNPADASLSATLNGAVRIGDITNNSRWSDNTGNGGIALLSYGDANGTTSNPTIALSGANAGGYSLLYLNRIDATSNPTQNGSRYIHFYHDGTDGGSIRGDSSGNLYQVLKSGTNWGFWTSGYSEALIVDDNADVMVAAGAAPTYTVTDNTSVIDGPTPGTPRVISNNKLHVGGSIQLNGSEDAIVFGTGTSTFLMGEELGFGWGGGLHMIDATYLRIRNNKHVYSTGNYSGSLYYAEADTNYYLDPDGDSQLNTVDIDDYIRHRGDTNTLIGFSGNDTLLFQTNGVNRLQINNGAFRSRNNTVQFYSSGIEIQKQSNGGGVGLTVSDENSAETPGLTGLQQGSITFWHADGAVTTGSNAAWYFNASEAITHYVFGQNGGASGGSLVPITNNSGALGNSSYRWASLHSGTGNFSGDVTAANMYASRYYDADDNTYYADPAGTSRFKGLQIEDTGGESILKFGPGVPANDDAHIEWRGASNGGVLRISTADDSDAGSNEPIEFGDYASTGRGGTFTQWAYMQRDRLQHNTSVRAPIFYDTDDVNYFGNFSGESRMDTIKLDGNAVVLREPTGTFGSLAVSGGGRNGYEGFSINDRSVFMHDGGNVTGVYNDVDNQWFWYGERGGVMRLMHAGVERARTENGYFLANQQLRTPIFYDSNDTNYYVDPNNTSRFNAVQALRYYLDHSTNYYMDVASGDYATMEVGGTRNGWAGYSIAGQWNFMASGVDEAGIYNDTDNKWVIRTDRNAGVDFYYNGVKQAETESGYFLATNQMRAPIYYDSNDTTYYLNPAAGNTNRALMIDGRIYRQGWDTTSNGDNNKLLEAQDYSHWIWNTATNWGIFWAGNNNAAYSYFGSSNPNELVFVGAGNVRASIDLDNGNAHFNGILSAGSIVLNGGNENIELVKTYGSGGADLVLFDGTEYFDKRVIKAMAPNESPLTTTTSEYVRTTDGPFAGSYVLQTSAYRTFYSDLIPVAPGEELYGEISVKYISGSGGLVYYGIERYDSEKRPIAGNTGTTYFVVGGANYTGTSWTTYRNHTTIPTSHTPYNGSDGGGCYYVRIRILMNYNSGGALRQFAGIMLKRRNAESNILVDDLEVLDDVQIGGDVNIVGDLTVDDITADIIDARILRDRDNTGYYVDPKDGSNVAGNWNFNNYNLNNINAITINDPGPSEGIKWNGGNQWQIYESPDDLSTNSGGNLQFTAGGGNGVYQMRLTNAGQADIRGQLRTPIFYDLNDTNWYVDPNSGSRIKQLDIQDGPSQDILSVYRTGSAPGNYAAARTINQYGNHSWGIVHEFRVGDISAQSVPSGTDRPSILFSSGYNTTTWSVGFGYVDDDFRIKQNHGHINQSWGTERFRINTSGEVIIGSNVYGNNAYFARYYDSNNTGYYVDPASTSNLNAATLAGTWDFNGGANAINITSSDIRSDGNSNWTGNPGAGVGKIQMHSNRWYIVSNGNSNRIVQFRQDGSDRSYIANDGRLHGVGGTASQDWRAPIFYDTNDTSYYSNPASDSRYNTLTLRGNRIGFINTAFDAEIRVTDDNPDGTGATFVFWGDQVEYNAEVATEVFRATRHIRAPLYYDLNDANYYGDFGGQSYMNDVRANIFYERENTAYYFGSSQGDARFRDTRVNQLRVENAATIESVNGAGRIYLGGNLHIDAQGGNDLYLNYYSGRRTRSFTPGQYEAFRVDTDRIVYAFSQFRTPIMYDTNDTNYYVDPNGTTRLNQLTVNSIDTTDFNNAQYWAGDIVINGNENTYYPVTWWGGNQDIVTEIEIYRGYAEQAPWNPIGTGVHHGGLTCLLRTNFGGWGGSNYDIQFDDFRETYTTIAAEVAHFGNQRGFVIWLRGGGSGGAIYHIRVKGRNFGPTVSYGSYDPGGNGSGVAPRTDTPQTVIQNRNHARGDDLYARYNYSYVYYDRDNTGYYFDGHSNSRWNSSDQNGYHTFNNYGLGVTGTYASTRLQLVFAMGSSYRPNSAGTSTANMYGIGWSHPNAGGLGGANQLNDHGMLIINNGGFRAAISSRAVFASDVRTPIYYDWNDTNYYVDPNGTSRLNSLLANRIYPCYNDNTGIYIDYPTGDYGSIQVNGGGKNGWEGYSIEGRYVFMSADNNECGIYNDIDNEWMTIWRRNGRTEIFHNGTWEEYAQPGYMQARGSYRAPIFYDSNDTGYYMDPNSTSNAAMRIRGGTLYGPNPTWGRYLYVGTNGNVSSEACVATTNGNLHLDARSGYGTYINWYVGGTTYINGTLQVNFIYDRDNTAYYWDGAGISSMNDIRANILYDRNDTAYYFGSGSGDVRGNNIRAWEFYADNWFRNYNSGEGLYNQATAMHWYSDSSSRWRLYSTSSTSQILFTTSGNNARGYVYADNSNNIGFLNAGGGWALRTNYSTTEIYGNGYASDFRAYIFYDRNNTGYFCDPNGRSRLAEIDYGNGSYYWRSGSWGWRHQTPYGYIEFGPANGSHAHIYTDRSNFYFNVNEMYMNGRSILKENYWNGSKYFGSDGAIYGTIFYDANNSGYYVDPASTSNMNVISNEGEYGRWWEPKGVGGNSGNGAHAYRIFQEGGGWGYPYPDLRIAFHTGIKLGANASYEGTRIYDDYPMGTIRWQFNGGAGYQYQYTWTNLTGYHGLYSGINGAHFYPNNASYGSWRIDGQRNGWGGIEFSYANTSLMMNTDTYGFHWNAVGWRFYNTGGSGYFPGNVVAYWSDRRLKENIEELARGTGLDLIYKLKPSKFNWKKEAPEVTGGVIKAGKEEVSIIAQETQEILPDAVVVNMTAKKGVEIDGEVLNDYLTINYDKITPFLIQAIKDLKDEIDDLKEELRTLKGENK